MHSIFYVSSRITCPNLIWRYIFCDNTTSTNNSSFPNSYRITNNHITSNKSILFYVYLTKSENSSFFIRIKKVSKYSCILSYCNTFLYCYKMWSNTIKIDISINPTRSFNIYPPNLTNRNRWCPRSGNEFDNHMKNICFSLLKDIPVKYPIILFS